MSGSLIGDPLAVLRGTGLKKTFGNQIVFEALDIELRPGELVLLRGENGAGKTTLIDLLTGNQRADAGRLEIRQENGVVRTLDARRTTPPTLARLGIVKCWQRPELFWSLSVRDNLKVAAAGSEDSAFQGLARAVRESLSRMPPAMGFDRYPAEFGLESLLERPATALSFGQSRRVSLALSAIVGTRALLLDEPLASLDREGAKTVNRLLGQLVTEQERAVLVVEHALNERLLAGLDYRVLELRCQRLEAAVESDRTRSEIRSPEVLWISTLEGGTGLRCQGPAQDLGDGGFLLCFRSSSAKVGRPLLSLEKLRVRRGTWELFSAHRGQGDGLSMVLHSGDIAILLARNGWGKSSLVKVIVGELPAAAGQMLLDGQPALGLPSWERCRRGLLYVETASPLFGNLSVGETLRLKRGADAESDVHFAPHREVRTLSGGQRQQLALHCALAAKSRLLVLDEPFNGLDRQAVAQWLKRLETAALEGKAILICLPA
ncbi:MAG: ATP-binding cassette domain-containing protein [Acidobacteriota bacterium]|nr:ATP-binding cassette domain-containing protein [Acidobacteriota bacterium]